MDTSPPETRWQGKATAMVMGLTADKAWSLLGDFCSLNKWITAISTCKIIEGLNNVPGCIRYCSGSINRADPTKLVGWSKERLVEYDQVNRYYAYEIVETNKGFSRYKATLRVQPDPTGCMIEWSYQTDPVKGWSQLAFLSHFECMTHGVAKKLEEDINGELVITD